MATQVAVTALTVVARVEEAQVEVQQAHAPPAPPFAAPATGPEARQPEAPQVEGSPTAEEKKCPKPTRQERAAAIERFHLRTEGDGPLDPIGLGHAVRELIVATSGEWPLKNVDDREFAYPPGTEQSPSVQETCRRVLAEVRRILAQPTPAPRTEYRQTFDLRQAHNELVVDAAKASFREAVAAAREKSQFLPLDQVHLLLERTRTLLPGWHPDLSNRPDVYTSFAGTQEAVALAEEALATHDKKLGEQWATLGMTEKLRAAEHQGRTVGAIELLEQDAPRQSAVTSPDQVLAAMEAFLNRAKGANAEVRLFRTPKSPPVASHDVLNAHDRMWAVVDRYTHTWKLDPRARYTMEQSLLHLAYALGSAGNAVRPWTIDPVWTPPPSAKAWDAVVAQFHDATDGEKGLDPVALGDALRGLSRFVGPGALREGIDDHHFVFPPGTERAPETDEVCTRVLSRIKAVLLELPPEGDIPLRFKNELTAGLQELAIGAAKASFRTSVHAAREQSRLPSYGDIRLLHARLASTLNEPHPDIYSWADVYSSVAGTDQAVGMVEQALKAHDRDAVELTASTTLFNCVKAADRHVRTVAAIERLTQEAPASVRMNDPRELVAVMEQFLKRSKADGPMVELDRGSSGRCSPRRTEKAHQSFLKLTETYTASWSKDPLAAQTLHEAVVDLVADMGTSGWSVPSFF